MPDFAGGRNKGRRNKVKITIKQAVVADRNSDDDQPPFDPQQWQNSANNDAKTIISTALELNSLHRGKKNEQENSNMFAQLI